MSKYRRMAISFLVMLIVLFGLTIAASATDLSQFHGDVIGIDDTAGISFLNSYPHAGTKYYKYSVSSDDENGVPTPNPPHGGQLGPETPDYTIGLGSLIQTASGGWYPDAVITKTSGTPGTIYNARAWQSGVYATGQPLGSQPHASSWVVTIYDLYYYPSTSTSQRVITLEHELGHAYGLAHVNYSIWPCAMANNNTVQPNDRRGMSVVTDVHVNHSNWIYSLYSIDQHKKRCGTCLGYYLEGHDFNIWTYFDVNDHIQTCSLCLKQDVVKESHDWTAWMAYTPSKHVRTCPICNYTATADHQFSAWMDYTSAEHKATCSICAYEKTAPHSYPSTWINYSSTTHRHACPACGRYAYANHSYPSAWSNYSSTQHRHQCTASGCGRYSYANHTYPSTWSDYSSTEHRHQCTASGCGRYLNASHAYPSTGTYVSNTQHKRTCTTSGCGHLKYEAHSYSYYGGIYVCSVCGYTTTNP